MSDLDWDCWLNIWGVQIKGGNQTAERQYDKIKKINFLGTQGNIFIIGEKVLGVKRVQFEARKRWFLHTNCKKTESIT